MEKFWNTCLLLTVCVAIVSTASISGKIAERKNSLENCTELKNANCTEKFGKTIKKRQTTGISLENVSSCNTKRQECIRTCKSENCLAECPICPEIQSVNGMRRVVVEGINDSFVHDAPIRGNNVTTVIKLINLVNNTNLIDIPTNVNLTNQNHVHVYQNDSSDQGGEFGLGYNRFGSCCLVIEPKSCTPTSRGNSCHHKRHKSCGQQCISRIIHAESRHRCFNAQSCKHRVGYIPQPRKPQCVYISTWPYVSCGGHHQQNCEGCYEHYGYGANWYYGGRIPSRCHACYDNAFNMGPLYRRGPVFQPFFYHQPPCYLMGTCNMPFCSGNGCYGHEYVDPAWGYMGRQQMQMPMMSSFPQSFAGQISRSFPPTKIDSSIRTENSHEYVVPLKYDLSHDLSDGSDWGIEMHKCRVVESNGTVYIKNCTDTEWDRNPFAASPSVYPRQSFGPRESPMLDYEGEEEGEEYETDHPSAYDGFDRTSSDNEIPNHSRHLYRRQTGHQRNHQIIYDD